MVTHLFMQNKNLKQIFKWPAIIGLLTSYGLVAALIDDGGSWEQFANLTLSIPIAAIIYFRWIKQ